MALSPDELAHLAHLAKLNVTSTRYDALQTKIDYFLTLAQHLNALDTSDVIPLTHPLELEQPLREDTATTNPVHFNDQPLTDHVRDNLYTVPTVLDHSN